MKRINVVLLSTFICLAASAQYKKASFFNKQGRTYGLATRAYLLGDGKGTPMGLELSFGRDRDGKQFFSSWSLQFIPSYNFSYTTVDENNTPATVNGKSKMQLLYGANYGFYLLKNDNSEQKFKPYVNAGFNIVVFGGLKYVSDGGDHNFKKIVTHDNFSAGLGGGVGCLYILSPVIGLKLDAGYTYQFNVESTIEEEGQEFYHMFTKHPYVTAGIRFRISSE